ncbi:uncharacterized protein METZ01_LOCUS121850, partial [marine metagenome]
VARVGEVAAVRDPALFDVEFPDRAHGAAPGATHLHAVDHQVA